MYVISGVGLRIWDVVLAEGPNQRLAVSGQQSAVSNRQSAIGNLQSAICNLHPQSMDIPVTAAVRFLREKKVPFVPHLYKYVEKGGTGESARQLGVDEHVVVKTLVFETNDKAALIVLMHGDREVSTKNLARRLGVKSVSPVIRDKASKITGYLVGGTSPFGTRTKLTVFVEKTIFELDRIFINGGKRGFLVEIDPAALRSIDAEEVEVGI